MSDDLRLSSATALNPVDSTSWSGRRQGADPESGKRKPLQHHENEEDETTVVAAVEEELGGHIDISA